MKTIMLLVFAAAIAASAQEFGWYEMANVPFEPSGKVCYYGAWLATMEREGRTFVYAAKGNYARDFCRYDVEENTWQQLESIPWGPERCAPYRGCRAASDSRRFVYMTKGNGTFGFWLYDAYEDRWIQLPDVPRLDTSGVYRGDLAYVELLGRYVYLLWNNRGYLCRYSIDRSVWEVLDEAPGGSAWYKGSFVVHDGDELLYAHKGPTHEHWMYDLRRHEWVPQQLTPMPHEAELGEGGCGVWWDGCIHALKGGNTNEFWRYSVAGDSWFQLDTIPRYGSTGRKKSVDEGGHLVSADGGIFYALKGNKTLEFWRYGPPVGVEERARLKDGGGRMSQTVCRGVLCLPQAGMTNGQVPMTMSDISGRKVMDLKPGANDIRHVAPGIYFVRSAKSGTRSAVRKVVIQR